MSAKLLAKGCNKVQTLLHKTHKLEQSLLLWMAQELSLSTSVVCWRCKHLLWVVVVENRIVGRHHVCLAGGRLRSWRALVVWLAGARVSLFGLGCRRLLVELLVDWNFRFRRALVLIGQVHAGGQRLGWWRCVVCVVGRRHSGHRPKLAAQHEVHVLDGARNHFNVSLLFTYAHHFLVELLGGLLGSSARVHLDDGLACGLTLGAIDHMDALIDYILALVGQKIKHILDLSLER